MLYGAIIMRMFVGATFDPCHGGLSSVLIHISLHDLHIVVVHRTLLARNWVDELLLCIRKKAGKKK